MSTPKYTIPKATIFRPYSKPGAGSPATSGGSGSSGSGGSSGGGGSRTTTPKGTAYYDADKKGVVTSDGKFYPTSNPNYTPAGYTKTSAPTSTPATQPKQVSVQEEQKRDTVVDSGRKTALGQPIYISPQQAFREQTTKPQFQILGVSSQQMQQTRREIPSPTSPQQQQYQFTLQWKKEQEAKTERAVAASKEAQLYSGITVESLRSMGYSTAETANILLGQTPITKEQYKSIEPVITRGKSAGATATTLATDKQRKAYESNVVVTPPPPKAITPLTFTQKFTTNIADWNKVVTESRVYKPISTALTNSANFFRETAEERRAFFEIGTQHLIAERYTIDDNSFGAKAFDLQYKIVSSIVDYQSKRDSAIAGFATFFADKPVTAGLIATTGAGVAAGSFLIGSAASAAMAGLGVKTAIITKVGAVTSKAVVGSGLTLFGASTLATGADIRDPDIRYEFYGEQAGKLAVAVVGAQTFKLINTKIAQAQFASTPKEATGVVRFTEGVRTDVMGRVKIGTKQYDFKTQSFKQFGKGTFTKDVGTIETAGKKLPFTSRQVQVGRDTFVRETNVKGAGRTVEVIKQTQEPLGFKSIPKQGLTVDTKISGFKETPRVVIGKDIKFDQKVEFMFDSKTVPKTTLAQRFTNFNKALGKRASLANTRPSDDIFGRDFTGTGSGLRPDVKTPTLGKSSYSFKVSVKTSPSSRINIPSSVKSVGTIQPTAGVPQIQSLFNVFAPSPVQAPFFVGFLGVSARGKSLLSSIPSLISTLVSRFDINALNISTPTSKFDVISQSISTPKVISTFTTITDTRTRFDFTPTTLISSPSFTPSIFSPFTPPPSKIFPGFGRTTRSGLSLFTKKKQKKAYKPTLRAVGLGLTKKGKKHTGLLTGLEERY